MLIPENSYLHKCQCGTEFLAPKGSLSCHKCLHEKIEQLERDQAQRDIEQQIKALDELKANCNIYMAFPTDKMIARECVTVEEIDKYHWDLKKQLRKGMNCE